MEKYILIEESLFTAQQKGVLKGFSKDLAGKYIQDNENTIRRIGPGQGSWFKNDNKTYLVLSWEDDLGKPVGILPRYSENGNNPKVNKIMTLDEIRLFINTNTEEIEIN